MTTTTDVILVIDDEPQIRRALADALGGSSTMVVQAGNATQGIELAAQRPPDLVVLDLGLPDRPGIDVCRELRAWSTAPIVVLSARHAESEKIALLDAGADDYVSKPFGLGEFVARIRAQLRRSRTPRRIGASVVEIDGLTIDVGRRQVHRDGEPIHLTPTEWAILRSLVKHAGRPVTHQQLFDEVWGRAYGNPQHYLRVYLTHLRRKLERVPASPRVIVTEPGVGYRLNDGLA